MRDLLIVGGGPAGLATAILAAQRGLECIVLEAGRPPFDKACGEGLMPLGAALLDGMGVELPRDGHRPVEGIRFVDGAREVAARFPGRYGVAARRPVLVQAMLERAAALGVDVRHGTPLRSWGCEAGGVTAVTDAGMLHARRLVGADGLRSRVRRAIGGERKARGRPRLGLRRHFEVAPWSPLVEVHWGPGLEAYVTPVGERCVGVALLTEERRPRFESLLERLPALHARLHEARTLSRARGDGPFGRTATRRATDRVALVGDAALFIDPVSGDGLTMAFTGARLLVDAIAAGRPLVHYGRVLPRRLRRSVLFSRLLVALSRRPGTRGRVMRALERRPELFEALLALAVGEGRWTALRPGDVLRLLAAFARRPSAPWSRERAAGV